jgi:hypothetical protein
MNAAVAHLEHAMAWEGRPPSAGVIQAIDGVLLLSGKLIDGAGWTVEEIAKAIEALGREIEKAAHYTKSHGKKK